jgi:hypothetical protein
MYSVNLGFGRPQMVFWNPVDCVLLELAVIYRSQIAFGNDLWVCL